ncbi:MAG: hypothetical protein P0Y66_09795 [Candidatus Kaistia colombiensis]|nr:MAG: hypothetical protein P0Y66_09795 [Kaistia sp.]
MRRLSEILKMFHRKGLVRVSDRDQVEQLIVLTIMPGITVLVPDAYVEALVQWLEGRAAHAVPPTGILAIATARDGEISPIPEPVDENFTAEDSSEDDQTLEDGDAST